jgi:hypothetical protein
MVHQPNPLYLLKMSLNRSDTDLHQIGDFTRRLILKAQQHNMARGIIGQPGQ